MLKPEMAAQNYKKKSIALAKAIIRSRGRCEKCGQTNLQFHGSHVMPVSYSATAADLNNILCLCAGCHKMKRDSWHEDPVANARWFENKWPGRYDELRQKAVSYSQNPFPKIDWQQVYEELKRG